MPPNETAMDGSKYKNRYWGFRHGRSLANEAAIIVSSLANGVKPEYGLSDTGRQQVEASSSRLAGELQAGEPQAVGGGARLVLLASPFSRTLQTADIVQSVLEGGGCSVSQRVAEPALRERYFGAAMELRSHELYRRVWEADARSSGSRPGGARWSLGLLGRGESVQDVSRRLQQLIERLEAQHSGADVVLVAHGDTLSILQATLRGTELGQHRAHGLETAGFVRMV